MEGAVVRRSRALMAWAPCAPAFVRERLEHLLDRRELVPSERSFIENCRKSASNVPDVPPWSCRFPVLVGDKVPTGIEGGILTVSASEPGVLPPRGGDPFAAVVEGGIPEVLSRAASLTVLGLPVDRRAVVFGRSATAAAWLAWRAMQTGRKIPDDLVVSADLVPGPGGAPCLAAVEGGGLKARVVAREMPNACLMFCGEHDGSSNVDSLPAGAPVADLERMVWGDAAVTDRVELGNVAAQALRAFEGHDYLTAESRYEWVFAHAGQDDEKMAFEACLRLAAVAVHRGRADTAQAWFDKADAVSLPNSQKGPYLVERLAGLAGMHIDAFRPTRAREILETPQMRHAGDADCADPWMRIQVLGAWRRLHLLEGAPERAREEQRKIVELAEGPEVPRSYLDLAWTSIRCGDLNEARLALCNARSMIQEVPTTYRLQTQAFLAWYAGRLVLRGGAATGLEDLIHPATLDRLLAEPSLQPAARWRARGMRAALIADWRDAEDLVHSCSPFQRWYLGLFFLDIAGARHIALVCLSGEIPDLSEAPDPASARDAFLASPADEQAVTTLRQRAVY
jgi:hypothetical protein